ncbi:MAG: nucleotide exchange factor GrpE [Candidatus Methylumidiphilus sp.]|nr:nucleotide exchange factor GrpE [Pseudomonadota bacterium]
MSEDQSLQEDKDLKPAIEAEPELLLAEEEMPLIEGVLVEDEDEPPLVDAVFDEPEATEDLTPQLANALLKADEYRDQSLRTLAEMDNLRRRTEKEVGDARKYAVEKFARELLVVLDSLELGIQAAAGDTPEVVKLREGSELTLKQFFGVLEKFNVKPIEALGAKFDPTFHQAMTLEQNDEVEPNTVVKVFQKGYTINDRLLRPAMVVIAKKA